MTSEELNKNLDIKQCGCGGEARLDKQETLDGDGMPLPCFVVYCTNCLTVTDTHFSEAEAVTAWNTAMGAKNINVPNKGFWKPVYASEATGFDPSLAGCDPVFNHVCSVCGQETWTNDLGEEYLSDFCPHCGADMR